jgi:hypothetical protein
MSRYKGALIPWAKQLGPEADYLPPYSTEVKESGATPPLPHSYLWRDV